MPERDLATEHLPQWDVRSAHKTLVDADRSATFAAIKAVDLANDGVIRWLFRLRGMPGSRLTLDRLTRLGFIMLDERMGSEVVYGIVGRFWLPNGDLRQLAPAAFRDFDQPGFAKAVWTFKVQEIGEQQARLVTETRVQCTDAASRRKFRAYWSVVGVMSGLIRRRALRLIKARAEAGAPTRKDAPAD
ncbi:MAG: hypothetical protein KJO98_13235 [Rhodothermia bacterium]|nr:hypothetical protein [Rhodothermia bacterium]